MYVDKDGEGVRLKVRLAPKSSRDEIAGFIEDAVKIKVKAPPVDGKANEALVKFLSKKLGVSKSSIAIVTGLTNRTKTVKITGLTPEYVVAVLET